MIEGARTFWRETMGVEDDMAIVEDSGTKSMVSNRE